MKILNIPQHSLVERFMDRGWQGKQYTSKQFDEIVAEFPDCCFEGDGKQFPEWGNGWFIKDEKGMAKLFKESWDTSD